MSSTGETKRKSRSQSRMSTTSRKSQANSSSSSKTKPNLPHAPSKSESDSTKSPPLHETTTSAGAEGIYQAEGIIGKRKYRGKVQFKVKWAGYPVEEATWEPYKNIAHCKEFIDRYEELEEEKRRIRRSKQRSSSKASSGAPTLSTLESQKPTQEAPEAIEETQATDSIAPQLESTKEFQSKIRAD